MKRIKPYIFSIFLAIFLASTAYGFPGMAGNKSTEQSDPIEQFDLANATESDRDIIIVQHLIEIDPVKFQSENKLSVQETLIFRNIGEKNFSGSLRTWVPDGTSDIRLGKSEMMTGGGFIPIPFDREGNIVSWGDFVEKNSPLPFLYVIEYKIAQEAKGKFSKKLAVPTYVSYRYIDRPGLPAIVIKVVKPEGSSVTFKDENRNTITSQDVIEEADSAIYRFSSPVFKEINLEITTSTVSPSGIAGYAILGIVILLVFSYPLIRKKSEKLQAVEGKIRDSLKREASEEVGKEEVEAEEDEEVEEEIAGEEPAKETAGEDVELSGRTKEELEQEKNEITAKLDELEKDYSSGNMLDEEYEELRNSYQEKLERINRRIEPPG